jgi:DNA-binding transcriptional LysR family regulator
MSSGSFQAGWHGVELRHLAALQAVGHERSFSVAAAALGYTQSAVSGQIIALERIVGARLVERIRGSRRVRLSEEGEILVAHATAIAARLEAAQSDIAMLHAGAGAGPALRIGTFPAVSRAVVADALHTLIDEDRDAEVTLRECYEPPQLLDLLEQGKLDLVFTLLPTREGPFAMTELYRDEHVLVVRRCDPLAARSCLSTSDLIEHRVIGLGPQRQPATAMRVDDPSSLVALVSAGHGVGIAPAHSVVLPSDLTTIELEGTPPPHAFALAWHEDRVPSPRARRFVELAVAAATSVAARPLLRAM